MGKKHIVEKTAEEVLAEGTKVEKTLSQVTPSLRKKTADLVIVHILSSYNNTKMTLTDAQGNVLLAQSAGRVGFKGSKKGTSFASSKIAQTIRAKEVEIVVKGVGAGRESALRALSAQGINIVKIKDRTPIPHGGCRPRKARRA